MATTVSLFILLPACLSADTIPPCRLVTAPTAGLLPKRTYILDTQLYNGGGVMHMVGLGVVDLVDIGISYGGSHIIGSSRITWQPHVALQLKVRIIEETLRSPALAVGFDSQGDGTYIKDRGLNRFQVKSRGVYIVVSRNYRFLGDFGFHGGVNYSLETGDGDRDPSFWAGFNKTIGESMEVCADYDFLTNDDETGKVELKRGYLNAAFKWNVGKSFTLEFDLKNVLRTNMRNDAGYRIENPEPSREIRFFYRESF